MRDERRKSKGGERLGEGRNSEERSKKGEKRDGRDQEKETVFAHN